MSRSTQERKTAATIATIAGTDSLIGRKKAAIDRSRSPERINRRPVAPMAMLVAAWA
jgi:hypothetical protein